MSGNRPVRQPAAIGVQDHICPNILLNEANLSSCVTTANGLELAPFLASDFFGLPLSRLALRASTDPTLTAHRGHRTIVSWVSALVAIATQ
jgi:hypothetical protein